MRAEATNTQGHAKGTNEQIRIHDCEIFLPSGAVLAVRSDRCICRSEV